MNHEDNTRKIDKSLKFYGLAKWLLGFLLVLLIVLVAVVQFLTLSSVQATTDRIQSCIDPKGTCYRSGDRRSSAAVKSINDNQKAIVIAASFCANQPENKTVTQIEACVNKELNK